MKHHIIVKFCEEAGDRSVLYREIGTLFQRVEELEGVHRVTLCPSCVDLPNRYDLMIIIEMEPEALAVYDKSPAHVQWKEEYSGRIAAKTIFDCM